MSHENREGKALPPFSKRERKNYTISLDAILKLNELALKANQSKSRYLENLILKEDGKRT